MSRGMRNKASQSFELLIKTIHSLFLRQHETVHEDPRLHCSPRADVDAYNPELVQKERELRQFDLWSYESIYLPFLEKRKIGLLTSTFWISLAARVAKAPFDLGTRNCFV